MRIEIVVDNQDPVIFPLNKPKLLIGSQETCDIVIGTRGISRKHLQVICENDSYFVIDQGSTNGSYINEERLVPGKKTEFTSFFPVRLGLNVLLILLSDEETSDLGMGSSLKNLATPSVGQGSESAEATKVISLKDLKSPGTESLLKKKQQTVLKRRSALTAPPKKNTDKTRMLFVKVLSLLLFGGAAYWQLFLNAPEGEVVLAPQKQTPLASAPNNAPPSPPRFPLVDDSIIVSPEKLAIIEKDIHCTSDLEKYFCSSMNSPSKSAVQVGTSLFIFFDGNSALLKAKEFIRPPVPVDGVIPSGDDWSRYNGDVKLTAALYSLSQYLPKDLNYDIIGDTNLVFVMKSTNNNQAEMFSIAFVPKSLKQFLTVLEPRHFELAQKYNAQVFLFLKEYYRSF